MSFACAYIKNRQVGDGHFVRVSNIVRKLNRKSEIQFFNIALASDQKKLLKIISKTKKIFFDISNKDFLQINKSFLKNIFFIINKFRVNISLIDSTGQNSILNYFKEIKINTYINPDIKIMKKTKFINKSFLGPSYAIGLNEFKIKYKINNKNKKNIFIFLTASKNKINIDFAKYIRKEKFFFSKYKINFISNDSMKLKNKFNDFKFINYDKILSQIKLNKYLKKTSLVISGQGNFKYEILKVGIPLIIIVDKFYYSSFKKRFLDTPIIHSENFLNLKKTIQKTINKKPKLYFKKHSSLKIF